ncbi:hypothetical protein TNCV_1826911 [Trichonephila clavipes]|nr:hypothetical protein TNCV_1826911 [Trichonephila clavipes]
MGSFEIFRWATYQVSLVLTSREIEQKSVFFSSSRKGPVSVASQIHMSMTQRSWAFPEGFSLDSSLNTGHWSMPVTKAVEYVVSDEAHFWLNGYVNKENCRIWSEANPQVYVETPLHPEKLTVWCALWAGGILLQK